MAPTDDQLRALCHSVEAKHPAWVDGWRREAAAFLREVAQTPLEQRSTRDFQRKLWESEAITSTSMGSVKIDAALDDPDFRQWFAHEGMAPLPEDDAARAAQLKATFDRLVAQFDGDHRTPWLKILRVLAALYPTEFTSLASRRLLHELAGQLLDAPPRGPIAANRAIVARLNSILGEVAPDDYEGLAARMSLPWLLHLHLGSEAEEPTEIVDEAGHTRLRPLPAARRRKGLTAFKGYFQSMLAILQGVEGGLTREDFIDLLRSERPGKKDSSHGTTINVLQSEFGVIHREGELYQLTPAGRAVLETGDPDELAEWLLTRVLGVDLALLHARDHGPMSKTELKRAIQKANPGWTGLFVPSAITSWLEHLGLLEQGEEGWSLSERGQAWAAQIHWEPAVLEVNPEDDGEDEVEVELEASAEEAAETIRKPGFDDILRRLTYRFPPALVAELHAGLWAHPRRHFAVLTGLSGAGKTQLARQYGLALAGGDEAARKRVKIVAVQPGWYDPGPLLGYINPIQPDAYVRTPVLEFLRRAVAEPAIPHVLILDEMNLSRPEQYLAPLLSAMETGDPVDLHSEGDVHDGVERRIPYPSNLVIIGTVNMDETTHGLSDKVLDRAFTLEFWDIDLADYAGWDRLGLPAAEAERLRGLLGELMQALVPARLHFGWRVVDDIVDFLARNHEHGGQLEFTAAVDAIVYAKIVPKLRGDDSPRFRAALEQARTIAERNRLTRCHTKLTELEHDLRTTGSARFWR
jgi:5-methylcytosine-specific restriction protein B